MEQLPNYPSENLERFIGQTIEIKPTSLLNGKRLYTTQNWVAVNKLKNALQNQFDDDNVPSVGFL